MRAMVGKIGEHTSGLENMDLLLQSSTGHIGDR